MLWTWLYRYADLGLLIARLGFGGGFVWYHGGPKLFDRPERWARTGDAMAHFGITFGYEWWGLAAALGETLGGLLIALCFLPAGRPRTRVGDERSGSESLGHRPGYTIPFLQERLALCRSVVHRTGPLQFGSPPRPALLTGRAVRLHYGAFSRRHSELTRSPRGSPAGGREENTWAIGGAYQDLVRTEEGTVTHVADGNTFTILIQTESSTIWTIIRTWSGGCRNSSLKD